ncbi:MAG: tRNA uridine-5-carboxymethylaminomethyl(34) synthesis enzyme MnmG, partial [Spirochaetes bacterium]|nr:tRNA uridine-5-carboxymethylaminomethyl(34) synthesis enzyme MnmG [Spirochaetota bacterium]
KMNRMEARKVPDDIDYHEIKGLKNEAREKLKMVRPATIGQASRISGVDPSDISILMIHIESISKNRREVAR